MKIGYFDCFAGAAGDMIVAAMLDAGLDAHFLNTQIDTLGLKGFEISITKTSRAGLAATQFHPQIQQQHHHRNLDQITEIIASSRIADRAKRTAIQIFDKLARAEAAVHGKDLREVTFHEVGALDSIVDIVAASVGFQALGIEKVYCSPVRVGGGTVKCRHGSLPVPAPATAELIKGIPIAGGPIQVELLTPTAAAILTTVADGFGPLPQMQIHTVGYGAGTLDPQELPNVVRLILGQTAEPDSATADTVCVIEANVDDQTPEIIAHAAQNVLQQGALDVFTTPIIMKNGRPAVQLSVICKPENAANFETALLEQGLTLGVRSRLMQRRKMARRLVKIQTPFGQISIKTGVINGKTAFVKPEFADCAAAAKTHNVALKVVFDAALSAYTERSAERDKHH